MMTKSKYKVSAIEYSAEDPVNVLNEMTANFDRYHDAVAYAKKYAVKFAQNPRGEQIDDLDKHSFADLLPSNWTIKYHVDLFRSLIIDGYMYDINMQLMILNLHMTADKDSI